MNAIEALERIEEHSDYYGLTGDEFSIVHAALTELAEIKARGEETINAINTSINALQNYTDVSWGEEETRRYRNQIELGIIELKSKISTITNILKGEKV